MYGRAKDHYAKTLDDIRAAGLEKRERQLISPQGASIRVRESAAAGAQLLREQLPRPLVAPARDRGRARARSTTHGFGLLERALHLRHAGRCTRSSRRAIAQFLGTDDTILYSSCFDANGGLFETLLGEEDAIISDALNHASIIDGIRLCKAERHRYAQRRHGRRSRTRSKATQGKRLRMIATDGVFSMDGDIAQLDAICDLAEQVRARW